MKYWLTSFIIIVLVIAVVVSIREALKLARKRYAEIVGEITRSEVVSAAPTQVQNHKLATYRALVEYRFVLHGEQIDGNQISLVKINSSVVGEIEGTIS